MGKQVRGDLYVHVSAIQQLDAQLRDKVRLAIERAGLNATTDFNVVRIDRAGNHVSLLYYGCFFDHPFPTLKRSYVVNLVSGRNRQRNYERSDNPPILHRKELLLPANHPQLPVFRALTGQLEDAGLFRNARQIGFAREWQERLRSAGYEVCDHCLIPLNGTSSPETRAAEDLDRHKTALSRYALSTPMQALGRYGYLDGSWTVFDYGCGKGDDLRILQQNGVKATGWDPYFLPDTPKARVDIVNLGFVINVIENSSERAQALLEAYSLASRLLSVSVMLARRAQTNGETFGDGVRTSRNTFQKYYTQRELRDYLCAVLDKEPVAVGPGVFFIFKDEVEEQRFLEHRVRTRDGLTQLISRISKPTREERELAFYDTHRNLIEPVWGKWLELGRQPELDEVKQRTEIEKVFGSFGKALRFLERFQGAETITTVFCSRKADLTVYFALQQFEQRKSYKSLPEELRQDVRTFFGSYQNAQAEAKYLLFSAGNRDLVRRACREAANSSLGWLEKDRALYLHTSLVERLPAILRIYVGCASYLYGDVTGADLIKIHIDSAKVTLMSFDDFEGKPLPRLLERIKIRFRDQDSERFEYGEGYEPPYLYRKSRFIAEDFPHYAEQIAFEQALEARQLFNFEDGHGPSPQIFEDRLKAARLEVEGFELRSSRMLPSLDERCGKYFTFRDLIECGETQSKTGIPNIPEQPETYNALARLATLVLDPVIDYFGEIILTYGFCSRELAKHIPSRIAPGLDQHASHELNTRGKPICKRLGAAVDFIVSDESMLEVAQWIVSNTPFDRLYFYGDDRPLHVSYGLESKREIVLMKAKGRNRHIPQVVQPEVFMRVSGQNMALLTNAVDV